MWFFQAKPYYCTVIHSCNATTKPTEFAVRSPRLQGLWHVNFLTPPSRRYAISTADILIENDTFDTHRLGHYFAKHWERRGPGFQSWMSLSQDFWLRSPKQSLHYYVQDDTWLKKLHFHNSLGCWWKIGVDIRNRENFQVQRLKLLLDCSPLQAHPLLQGWWSFGSFQLLKVSRIRKYRGGVLLTLSRSAVFYRYLRTSHSQHSRRSTEAHLIGNVLLHDQSLATTLLFYAW